MSILTVFAFLALFSSPGEHKEILVNHYPKGLEHMEDFEVVENSRCQLSPTATFKCNKVHDKVHNEDFLVIFDAHGKISMILKLKGEEQIEIYPASQSPQGIQMSLTQERKVPL